MITYLFQHFARPDVRYFCDLDYDPFLFMEDSNKVYGTCQRIDQVLLSNHVSPLRLHDIYARLGADDTNLMEFDSRYGKT